MLASRADVYTIRCSCKQWPCTYTAPCVARTCWEESQTHIAAPLWQRRSTHPARTLMHAANAPRRGDHAQISSTTHRSSTGRRTPSGIPGHTQHIPIRPRSDTQPPMLEAVQHPQPRPGGIHAQQHTARPPPTLPAASTFRRGDHPQTRQGEHHQHDHSPTPSKSHTEQRPALEADRRSRRE